MSALLRPHEHYDLGTLTIGAATGLVCSLDNVTWRSQNTNVDVRGACRPGALNQRTKRQGTLSAKFYLASATGFVASDYDLTALQLGGIDYIPQGYSIQLNATFDKAPLPSIGISGKAEGVVGQNYNGTAELQIDDTDVVQQLVIAAESANSANAQTTLLFSFGGRTIAFPIMLDGDSHSSSQAQYQKVSIPFLSQAPAKGTNFPTTPNGALPGSPQLLDYALLSPRTNLPFTFTSKLTHGLVRTGFLTWNEFGMTIGDGAIIDFSPSFSTFGDWSTVLGPSS